MTKLRKPSLIAIGGAAGLALALTAAESSAITAQLGSNGSDGALNVTTNTVLPLPLDGVLNFTTVNVDPAATLSFSYAGDYHPGVVLLATGDIVIDGTIDLTGSPSIAGTRGPAGPGGTRGGPPRYETGNSYGYDVSSFFGGRSAVGLRPYGGDGGRGSYTQATGCSALGAGGGGGGGAIALLSNTSITGTGTIDTRGGQAAGTVATGTCSGKQPAIDGADGNIRLIAPSMDLGALTMYAALTRWDTFDLQTGPSLPGGANSQAGQNVDAFPATLPTAVITSVNGISTPPAVVLPLGTSSPVTVTVQVDNCTADTATAVVFWRYQNNANGQYYEATLNNPTGTDNIDVSLTTGFNLNYRGGVAIASVLCGSNSSP